MEIWILNPPYFPKYSRPQRSPAVTKSGTIYFPIWLSSCAGVLEKAGHDIMFTDAPARGYDLGETLRLGKEFRPELIVMDTSTPSILNDTMVCEKIKEALPDVFVVMVGTHVSALPDETLLKSESIDAVARHEYEYTILELADVLSKSGTAKTAKDRLIEINGLSLIKDGKVINSPSRPFIEDLDELPWVSRVYKKYLHIEDYFNPNALFPMVTLNNSRGCPFRCSFCVYPQTFTGRKFRYRSINDVLNEVEYVIKEFPGMKSIFFEDDTLTANKKRCIEFSDAILERGIRIAWTANSRIELDLETMIKLKAAGCYQLCVGFESGDQQILDTMSKGTKKERMFQFMEDAKKAGILIHGCFIIGFPGETVESIDKTIDMALELKPDTIQMYPVMVYPGTEAYDDYIQKGWLTADDYSQWLTPDGLHNCVVRNEHLTSRELVELCDKARRKFYLRPGYLVSKFWQVIFHPSEIVRKTKAGRTFFKHLILGSGA
jgi:radical SAM superfamily enzyme YgiQ (UPF0313 family)